jgi:hypothetical protein
VILRIKIIAIYSKKMMARTIIIATRGKTRNQGPGGEYILNTPRR